MGKSTDQKITVQKQVADGEYYKDFNEITIEKKVKKAIKIVKNADRTSIKVEMSRYPDYKFQFPFKSRNGSEDKIASYSLWVNSNGKYVGLNEQESKVLYKILTEGS